MNGDADNPDSGEGEAPPPPAPGLQEVLGLGAEPGPTSTSTPARSMTFEERLRTMYLNKEDQTLKNSADLRVMVLGDKAPMYRLHKELFMMASPVFDSLLRATDGGSYSVRVEIHTSVFQFVKHFLYVDDLPEIQGMDMKLKILSASVQYEIDRLITNIIGKIKESMRKEDAFKVLQTGRELEIGELESLALEMIFKNGEELLSNAYLDEFCTLGHYDVSRILSSDLLECNEFTAFNAALRWAKDKAKYKRESEAREAATKYYFRQIITCIRFPLLSPTELAQATARDDIIIDDDRELVKLFQHALLPREERNKISLKFEVKPRSGQGALQGSILPPKLEVVPTSGQEDLLRSMMPPPPLLNGNLPHIPVRKRQLSGDNRTVTDSTTPTSSTNAGKRIRFQVGQNGCDTDGEDDLFRIVKGMSTNKTVCSYEDLCRRYFKEDLLGKLECIEFRNVTFTQLYRSPAFPNCKDFVLDAKLSFIRDDDDRVRDMKNFIRYFDPMRYIVYNTKTSMKPLTAADIWSLGQSILLKFNGVTFLKVSHVPAEPNGNTGESQATKMGDTLVLNYIRDSRAILSNDQLKPSTLAISNCEFLSPSPSIKEKGRNKRIETLILYHCWGDWGIEEIMKDYPNLNELVLWKYTPRSSANIPSFRSSSLMTPLCMNFSHVFAARNTIRKIVLFQSELKFPMRLNHAATTVSELHLDRCHVVTKTARGAHVAEVFHLVFPKLKRFFLKDQVSQTVDPHIHGNLATSDLVNCVCKKIATIEWFRVVGLKWNLNNELGTNEVNGRLDESEDRELLSFLQKTAIISTSTNFLLEKVNDTWKGEDYEEKQEESVSVDGGYHSHMDKLEYDWFSLNHFFESYQTFEDYFISDPVDGFPQHILWT